MPGFGAGSRIYVILKVIFFALEVLLLFNLLIFVHELATSSRRGGGLKIARFAIWFGKPIWKTKINGVEYALGSIPAGVMSRCPRWPTMRPSKRPKAESFRQTFAAISALDKIHRGVSPATIQFSACPGFSVV